MQKELGISIIVCNYNADLSSILFTLASCIKQTECDFEVLYCDDGSKNNFEKEIIAFFSKHKFSNYKMLCLEKNAGTVQNIFNGLKNSTFNFVKTIGAGDVFYSPTICKEVVSYMLENNLDYCFGDGVYFYDDGKDIRLFNLNEPAIQKPYNKDTLNRETIIKNLMIYNDFILGAALFAKKDTYIKYYEMMASKVKYEEDAIITASIIDGAKILRFPHYCVCYEYGTGISTNSNTEFQKLLFKDKYELSKYIHEHFTNRYSKKALKIASIQGNSKKDKIKRVLICPSKICFKSKSKKALKVTKPQPDFGFYKTCKEISK